jgi:hypothetical protein
MNDWGPYVVVFILGLVFIYLAIQSIPRKPPKKRFDWLEWLEDGFDDEPKRCRAPNKEEEDEPKPDFWKVR